MWLCCASCPFFFRVRNRANIRASIFWGTKIIAGVAWGRVLSRGGPYKQGKQPSGSSPPFLLYPTLTLRLAPPSPASPYAPRSLFLLADPSKAPFQPSGLAPFSPF